MTKIMPTTVDWTKLAEYESTEKNSPAPCEKKSNTTSNLPLGTTAPGFLTILAMS